MCPGRGERLPVEEIALDRVSSRLLIFVFDLLRQQGVDPRALASDLRSFAAHKDLPAWVTWSDYITTIHRLGDVAGGPSGIAAGMRATLSTAYSELRGLAGFFPGPVPFFSFVTHHLMRELVPGAEGRVEVLSDRNLRVRYRIADSLVGSILYFHGTVTLLEVFPTHFGLPEARVEIISMTDRTCELFAVFPDATANVKWAEHLDPQPATPANSLRASEMSLASSAKA